MLNLGQFKAGDQVFYAANFHDDQGSIEDPTYPEAQLRDASGAWSDLPPPTKQNAKTGHFGGSIDTAGFSPGQHVIRIAGTESTSKTVATDLCFTFIENSAKDIYDRIGSPQGASIAAYLAEVHTDIAAATGYVDELETRLTATRAANLENLDATVSSRAAAEDIFSYGVEGAHTFLSYLRLMASALFLKTTGSRTTNPKFRDLADANDRIDATVDGNGNRTEVTLDGS